MSISFFSAALIELIIVEVFVLAIWMRVFVDAVVTNQGSIEHRRLILTSIGLVFNSVGLIGVIAVRLYEYHINEWPFVWALTGFYAILSISNFLFIVSAQIGTRSRWILGFFATTVAWILLCVASNLVGVR